VTERLRGKVAVVTGSSRGIGRAIASAFHAEGALVVVNSRDAATASAVAQELGQGAIGVAADVSTEAGAELLVAAAVEEYGRIDILVNNAGRPSVTESVSLSLDEWNQVLQLNLTGTFLCSQRAARSMLAGGGGSILNIASLTGFAAFPKRLAYGVSKAGVVMLTRVLATEWAPSVRVNAIAPGYVKTDFVEGLAKQGLLDIEALKRRTPQGRLAAPEEIAKAAVFLSSDDAAFVTGETLVVDGGWLAYGFV
jgi:NAD(P)-dependent dehydrogenase (short-subunit alcohol dehydrogenase family)